MKIKIIFYTLLFTLFVSGLTGSVFAKNEDKLQVCKAREKIVKQRVERLQLYSANMLEVFGAIAGRVEQYYVSKVVPSGKEISNYNTLATDIKTKHDAVEAALTKAKTNSGTFTCDTENPKAALSQIHTDMKTVKDSLKDYRTSIKNMIVAVRTANAERNQ